MLGSRGEALGLGTGVLGAHSEGVVAHGLDHVSEEDLRGERVAVIESRSTVTGGCGKARGGTEERF